MSEVRAIVEDYGWRDPHETCAHDYIKQVIIEILNRLHLQRIIDLGCGNGALTHELAKAGFDVIGCELIRMELRSQREIVEISK